MSRLAKLLGMLGSDFDGERATAAAMISKMAKDAKLSIADLVMRGGERIVYRDRVVEKIVYRDRVVEKIVYRDRQRPEPFDFDSLKPRRRPTDILTQLARAIEFPEQLSGYELEFIDSILTKYTRDGDLSDKQMRVARRILDKVFGEPLI